MEGTMSRYQIDPIGPDAFADLMKLEDDMFGHSGDGTLGAYYIRLCCDIFGDSCFIARVHGEPVGYLLAFVRGREVYVTTLALKEKYQGSRVIVLLLRALVNAVATRVDRCWFTVEEENKAARALHKRLGATELKFEPDYYGEGRGRIISCVEREAFFKLKRRFVRLGLVSAEAPEKATAEVAEVAPAAFAEMTRPSVPNVAAEAS
jgi:ribosomal protein S18 acetylase RimI-like enzyme